MIYATNNENTYKNIGKKPEASAEDNSYAKDIKGKKVAYIIDFNALSQPAPNNADAIKIGQCQDDCHGQRSEECRQYECNLRR